MRLGLFTTLSFALLLPLAASAQSGGLFGETGKTFIISSAPQYPAPLSVSTLSFLSNSLDLANATLTVSVDGKNLHQGAVQPVSVTLGKAGSITNVVATISTSGTNYKQTLSIQPQDVSLIAEPISSVPPLYPGKSSVPLEGDVRVVAVANFRNASGQALNPSTLSYSWTVDDTKIANSSGIGKTAIMVASPLQYRARNISVTVTNQDGNSVGGASLSLTPLDPLVRIYENDPLLGILFNRALSNTYTIDGSEATLYAAPFSFPTTNGEPVLRWFLNGSTAQTGSSITLRPTGSGQGNASLSLVSSSGGFSTATMNLSLSFGETPSFNLFGL
ncbi:MAG: hypothetical protein NUV60_02415 [Patescibacteria group bacterium]|nr:hypothetical protein [Patescibacteria group bacterium]